MSEVKRYHFESFIDSYYKHRQFVLASDYDTLAAEAQALRDERDSQQRVAIKAMEELAALRARVVVVLEPVTMDGTTTIREYVANAVPKDTPMDKWTQGYEECKRRIHAMFEQPCNKRINGKTVSEGLLRQLLDSDGIDGIFDAQQNYAAHQELRALLNQDKENGNG
ncbi:TPA: hypothetical protein L4V44_002667 [Pseudomonas aeruginosa]|nr:hypothetical protein [Pseudomonas aeruginosa]